MDTFVFLLEIMGTIAFSISGAMTGIEKKMDIFGISILGLTTSVGGGIIRDLMIGQVPPKTFQSPIYAQVAIITAIFIFILAYYKILLYNTKIFELIVFVMDSLGLGIFTVVGISTAHNTSLEFGSFLLVFVGVLTGVGGGVLRDILAGNLPYIFRKHVYACASMAGAVVCVYTMDRIGLQKSMLCGMLVVVLIRFLSAHFEWNLPRMK